MVVVTATAPLLAVAGGFCKTSEIDACMQHRCDARSKLRTADSSFASLAEIGAVRLQLGQIGRAVRLVVGLDVVPEATWKALVPTFLTALFELRERVRRAPRVAARGGALEPTETFPAREIDSRDPMPSGGCERRVVHVVRAPAPQRKTSETSVPARVWSASRSHASRKCADHVCH